MPRTTKWGDRTFKQNNAEDDAQKKKLFDKLQDLGGGDDLANFKPDTIHAMDPSWQSYSAKSFAKVVNECKKLISKYLKLPTNLVCCTHLTFVLMSFFSKREWCWKCRLRF